MKSVTVHLAIHTVSFFYMLLCTCERYMLRQLIRSATTGPDVDMVMSTACLIGLMFGGDVGKTAR